MTAAAMVKAEDVHKSFGHVEVLKGIDLEVAPGEVFCLIGPSGSGKSTFLRCINHLEKIDAGRLYVDGELVGYRAEGRQALRAAEQRGRRAAPRHRHGVPALQPVPAHDGAGERHGGAGPGEGRAQGRRARARRSSCWTGSASPTRRTATPPSSPAASSSAWRSPARWRWSRS